MAVHVSQGSVDVTGVFPLVVTAYVPRVVALGRVVEVGGLQPFEGPLWDPAFYALETENGAQVPTSMGSRLVWRFLTPVGRGPRHCGGGAQQQCVGIARCLTRPDQSHCALRATLPAQ